MGRGLRRRCFFIVGRLMGWWLSTWVPTRPLNQSALRWVCVPKFPYWDFSCHTHKQPWSVFGFWYGWKWYQNQSAIIYFWRRVFGAGKEWWWFSWVTMSCGLGVKVRFLCHGLSMFFGWRISLLSRGCATKWWSLIGNGWFVCIRWTLLTFCEGLIDFGLLKDALLIRLCKFEFKCINQSY